jgi:hypothetical protein
LPVFTDSEASAAPQVASVALHLSGVQDGLGVRPHPLLRRFGLGVGAVVKETNLNLRVEATFKAALKEEAAAREMSMADLVRLSVGAWVEQNPRQPKFTSAEVEAGRREMKEYMLRLIPSD